MCRKADIKMTMLYAHPTTENTREAVNVLATVFEQKSKMRDIHQQHEKIGLERKDGLAPSISNN